MDDINIRLQRGEITVDEAIAEYKIPSRKEPVYIDLDLMSVGEIDFDEIKNPYGVKLSTEKEAALVVSKEITGWTRAIELLKGGWLFGQKKEGYGEYE